MKLQTLTREQVQQVRVWRNEEPQFLRTPYLLTEQMQDDFYDNVINNRDSKHRYFAIMENEDGLYEEIYGVKKILTPDKSDFIGMGGLTNIEWENGTAEISLIIKPEYRKQGKGKEAVVRILWEAFRNMRLFSVYGEVYDCGNRGFWEKTIATYKGYSTELKNRKFYNNRYYGSLWFSFQKDNV